MFQIFSLRTIFAVNVLCKIAANASQLEKCILLHAYSRKLRFSAARTQTKTSISLLTELV